MPITFWTKIIVFSRSRRGCESSDFRWFGQCLTFLELGRKVTLELFDVNSPSNLSHFCKRKDYGYLRNKYILILRVYKLIFGNWNLKKNVWKTIKMEFLPECPVCRIMWDHKGRFSSATAFHIADSWRISKLLLTTCAPHSENCRQIGHPRPFLTWRAT